MPTLLPFKFILQFPEKCPALPSILNGNVILATNGSVTMATYICVPGYVLAGDTSRNCEAGLWLGSQPTCCKWL